MHLCGPEVFTAINSIYSLITQRGNRRCCKINVIIYRTFLDLHIQAQSESMLLKLTILTYPQFQKNIVNK